VTKLVYLTYNDLPGGIFTSQVAEVCKHLSAHHNVSVTLVCFISRRNFSANKQKVLSCYPEAIVLPMFPGIRNWKLNRFSLKRKLKALNPKVIIARGPFATLLAKASSSAQICFDARGAYQAEFSEYDVSSGKFSSEEIGEIEGRALRSADFRIAVSHALVAYWKSTYGFATEKYVVIPCTLADIKVGDKKLRTAVDSKVRIVFSGGNGKWQNLDAVSAIMIPRFSKQPELEMIFLTNSFPEKFELRSAFPERVKTMWLKESEVHDYLSACDYGWMVRDTTITNRVASPVKFAAYLSAGLRVLISPDLGDFSEFVTKEKCGSVIVDQQVPELKKVTDQDKNHSIALAEQYFTKKHYNSEYGRVVKCE